MAGEFHAKRWRASGIVRNWGGDVESEGMRSLGCQILLCAALVARPALAATTLSFEVLDDGNRPLRGVILSVEGDGSTSAPTDIAGKTYIAVSHDVQPGETILLVLVSAPPRAPRKLTFFQPWNGRAIAPKPPSAIEVILGIPGNLEALENPRVVDALAHAVVSQIPELTYKRNKQSEEKRGIGVIPRHEAAADSLRIISEQAGFDPVRLDATIRMLHQKYDLKSGMSRYVADVPTDAAVMARGHAHI